MGDLYRSIEHAFLLWGLVTRRHNKVRDALGDLDCLVWASVVKEPVMHDGSAVADTLITDLCVS